MSIQRSATPELMDLDDFEEHLADKPAHEKWELLGGRVIRMMVGARWSHNRIVNNINVALSQRLRGTGCFVYAETFALKDKFLRLMAYPDIMVHCGRPDPDDTSVSDPVVLFEVTSPGGEARDRIVKADLYRRLPSLRHFVLVERDAALVTVDDLVGERTWTFGQELRGLDAVLPLPALGVALPLAEIYRDVIEDGAGQA
ncbi:MAG TPA: Uma2 family endonuclease [Microvirga sp.]|jgi:Uma2 family endonuclease|nr:Uma2 family endonuclease [Microvirga sp.]